MSYWLPLQRHSAPHMLILCGPRRFSLRFFGKVPPLTQIMRWEEERALHSRPIHLYVAIASPFLSHLDRLSSQFRPAASLVLTRGCCPARRRPIRVEGRTLRWSHICCYWWGSNGENPSSTGFGLAIAIRSAAPWLMLRSSGRTGDLRRLDASGPVHGRSSSTTSRDPG